MTSTAVSISTPTTTTTTTTTAFEEDDSPSLRLTIPGAASSESLPTPAATPPPDPTSPTSPAAKRLRTEDVESCRLESGEVPPPEEDHSETPDAPKGPQITVVLGHGGATEEFSADEEVLCKLPFFALALREGYRETVTKVVRMPDDDPELVQCLLQYLTTGEYKVPSSAVLVMGTSMSTQCKKETRMRLKLFHTSVLILADKYMCVGLSKLAALNLRKIVLSPMSFVNYMVSVYEMTPPGSPLRIGYFVDYGYKDELLVVHPQWTISSHTRASITRLLESQNTEDRFVDALDRCPQLAIDLVALISKGKQPVGRAILQCPGAAKFLLLHHCKQFYDKRPWTSKGEIVTVPWGWWKGLC